MGCTASCNVDGEGHANSRENFLAEIQKQKFKEVKLAIDQVYKPSADKAEYPEGSAKKALQMVLFSPLTVSQEYDISMFEKEIVPCVSDICCNKIVCAAPSTFTLRLMIALLGMCNLGKDGQQLLFNAVQTCLDSRLVEDRIAGLDAISQLRDVRLLPQVQAIMVAD